LPGWQQQRQDDGSDFLFTSQKGGRLDRSQFFRLFRAIASEAGLPAEKQHPHVLKHYSEFRQCEPRPSETAARPQIDWLHDALHHDQRSAGIESHRKRPDENFLSG
jgi:hypothetical protein